MRKFHQFKMVDKYDKTKHKSVYINTDFIIGVFENVFCNGMSETVINMSSGANYAIAEPIDEVLRILEGENA